VFPENATDHAKPAVGISTSQGSVRVFSWHVGHALYFVFPLSVFETEERSLSFGESMYGV
jgi:hypothetical protein